MRECGSAATVAFQTCHVLATVTRVTICCVGLAFLDGSHVRSHDDFPIFMADGR